MYSPMAHELAHSGAPEVSTDDLAFISQFAEVIEKPSFESASISFQSGGAGAGLDGPTAPLPTKIITSAVAEFRSIGGEDVDSEDEIEAFLTDSITRPKASTSEAKHVVK